MITGTSLQQEVRADADAFPASLSLTEYIVFLQGMRGITYDVTESETHFMSLLYKPQQVEAAISGTGTQDPSAYQKNLSLKGDYHYFLLQYRDKQPSVTGARLSQTAALKAIGEQLLVVRNHADTLHQLITEVVPAVVMGQPDQLLLLVPRRPDDASLAVRAGAGGEAPEPVSIELDMQLLSKFPRLKL